MSEYERVKGTLTRLDVDDYEEFAKDLLRVKGEDLNKMPTYCHSYLDWLTSDYYNEYNEYIVLDDVLYRIEHIESEMDAVPYFCNLTKLDNKTYSFDTMFYNGGTCWTEMVEDEIRRQKNE